MSTYGVIAEMLARSRRRRFECDVCPRVEQILEAGDVFEDKLQMDFLALPVAPILGLTAWPVLSRPQAPPEQGTGILALLAHPDHGSCMDPTSFRPFGVRR